MSKQPCLVLSVLLTVTVLLAACAPATAPVQPTAAPGEIPQSGDPCGGTGGKGQIVSMGNNEFTLKRNDGSDLVVHLAGKATVRTSVGSASLSDLRIGCRVTLVGSPNPDGSFTANTVVVCNEIKPEAQSGQ